MMPRQARLDSPDLLQHVMARGIERRKIFRDDKDRASFLERLAVILEETQTQCFAWSLIPNHFHLLLRTGPTPLSKVMRRLMTGYAVTFNKRHKRSGHLFQNRYKSVVCEEDSYLLELIRYLHLNPLRASLVNDLKKLNKYLWTGHSAILGKRKKPLIPSIPGSSKKKVVETNIKSAIPPGRRPLWAGGRNPKSETSLAEKTIQDVLLSFGSKTGETRRSYRQFVKNGIDQGTRPELQGGGLVRSAGGEKSDLLGRNKEEREKGDERILGSGDFVETILGNSSDTEPRREIRISLELLSRKVASHFKIKEEDLRSPVKKKSVIEAKSVFGYIAINKMPAPCNACPVESLPCITQPHSPKAALFHRGEAISLGGYSGREIGRFLNMRSYSAIRRAQEGKKVIDKSQFLWNLDQE